MSVPGQYGRHVADPKTMRVAVRVKCCTFMRHNSTACLAFFAASLVYDSTTGRVCCEDRDDYASGVSRLTARQTAPRAILCFIRFP